MKPTPRPACVAGMHRSGTSMVARLLKLAGLYLGEEADLMRASSDNPDGFWEHLGFVTINDELLTEHGGGWDFPVAIPEPPANEERLALVRNKALSLVAQFDGHQPWGWKDPRNSLTLPFWQAVA